MFTKIKVMLNVFMNKKKLIIYICVTKMYKKIFKKIIYFKNWDWSTIFLFSHS